MPVDIPDTSGLEQQQKLLLSTSAPAPVHFPFTHRRPSAKAVSRRNSLKGPLRALKLCVLTILLPGILVAVPLYMRFHVYGDQMYPVGMSDMRLLDNHVSTTWCQRQVVKANATFNAFLLPEQPKVQVEPIHLAMSRDLYLEDDTKEYWAFYLLKGSSITVSTCVSGPGASLIVIRGHKHLHDCAYIGDNSSEEQDEVERAAEEQEKQEEENRLKRGQWPLGNSSEARLNVPEIMRRARPGISFHHGAAPLVSQERLKHSDSSESDDDTEHVFGHILGKVAQARIKAKPEKQPNSKLRGSSGNLQQHTNRESVETELVGHAKENARQGIEDDIERKHPKDISMMKQPPKHEIKKTESPIETHQNDDKKNMTSAEVFEDVLKKLQGLGSRGKGVLERLNQKLGEGPVDSEKSDGLDALRKMIRTMLEEQANTEEPHIRHNKRHGRKQKGENISEEDKTARNRREITLSSDSLGHSLNEDDEEGDVAIEDLKADGIADHHDTVNETTSLDVSRSEFWSSFSSSEEALLNCAGLILNLPLTPNRRCDQNAELHTLINASLVNKLTYRVPRNGYYFFVFSSENEVTANYIHTHFELEKIVYNVSNSVNSCRNSTDQCALALHFFSSEKVVLEVPVPLNETLWNEEYIVVSTCEPRTALYLSCVIAVPLLIVIFAFQ